jgi:D-alanyl-D-alanine carboxypeptidase
MLSPPRASVIMKARFLLCLLGLVGLLAVPARAQIATVASPSGPVPAGPYLAVDVATGEVLVERNAGISWQPASLTKMMTIYLVFEELKAGRLQLGSTLAFSENARAKPASKLVLAAGQSITVEQGLQALVARSANDVATAFAERLAGSEPAFAQRMTEAAMRLGMTATQFRNANGLPDDAQQTTARDMAILALALIKDFPQYYSYFRTQEFYLGKTKVGPGVKFLDLYAPYADGLKTGFVCASGFNIVGSAVRDGRRLVAVAFGFGVAICETSSWCACSTKPLRSRPVVIARRSGSCAMAAADRRWCCPTANAEQSVMTCRAMRSGSAPMETGGRRRTRSTRVRPGWAQWAPRRLARSTSCRSHRIK